MCRTELEKKNFLTEFFILGYINLSVKRNLPFREKKNGLGSKDKVLHIMNVNKMIFFSSPSY